VEFGAGGGDYYRYNQYSEGQLCRFNNGVRQQFIYGIERRLPFTRISKAYISLKNFYDNVYNKIIFIVRSQLCLALNSYLKRWF